MRVQYPNEVLRSVAPKYQRDDAAGRDTAHAPMTLAQASYLMTLCEETHEALDDSLTQAEAAQRIAELEEATGRGKGHASPTQPSSSPDAGAGAEAPSLEPETPSHPPDR